jgi:acyl carrier protein
MKNETDIRQDLREWISQKSGKMRPEDISDDTPIIEQRIIKSLQIPDLILYIEEHTGRPIDVEQLKPGVFRNIDTIYRNFFERV